MTQHLGMPIPSAGALMEKISTKFRRAVESFAVGQRHRRGEVRRGRPHDRRDAAVPWIRQAATGRSGVAAVGVAQEFQRVWAAYQQGHPDRGAAVHASPRPNRPVTCYYFYLWMRTSAQAFITVCACFPYPAKYLGQRARVGQAAGAESRDPVYRAVQRVRGLR